MGLNKTMWAGQRGTFIWYNHSKSQWYLGIKHFDVTGRSSAPQTNFLLGNSDWTIANNRDCSAKEISALSMTSCQHGDFNCKSGHCIPIKQHCDTNIDCQDRSDELDSSHIYLHETYKIGESPPGSRNEVDIHLQIKDILDIEEKEGFIRTRFRLSYCWKDPRVLMTNVRRNENLGNTKYCGDQSKLSSNEHNSIWQPLMRWNDIDLLNRNTNEESSICFGYDGDDTPVYLVFSYGLATLYGIIENAQNIALCKDTTYRYLFSTILFYNLFSFYIYEHAVSIFLTKFCVK